MTLIQNPLRVLEAWVLVWMAVERAGVDLEVTELTSGLTR